MGKGKAKGKGKKGGDGGGDEGAELNPIQIAQMFQAENQALQRKLAERTEEANKALTLRKELQQRIVELKGDFDEEQRQTFLITADMTRQYKTMQEELLNRINILENTISELKEQLELSTQNLEETVKDKDTVIAEKDRQIEEHKRRMEEMAHEFGDMLKETLDKMSERIEIEVGPGANGTKVTTEGTLAVQNKLAEYSLNLV